MLGHDRQRTVFGCELGAYHHSTNFPRKAAFDIHERPAVPCYEALQSNDRLLETCTIGTTHCNELQKRGIVDGRFQMAI